MRAIKFRAWDTQEKKWFTPVYEVYEGKVDDLLIMLKGDLVHRTFGQLEHESVFPGRFILVQFTGLTDKNGKEIYEGDIVERVFLHPVKGPYKQQAKVIWSGARWWLEHLDIKPDGRMQADWLENRWVADCEVIGNIYGNPDLLQ